MSHENAPATKLLATNCAACGRALVDAESVETGIGPECRKRYATEGKLAESVRAEANQLVWSVARKGVSKQDAWTVIQRLAQLGCATLADRIAKRFRIVQVAVEELRAEYAKLRADFCYDNCHPREFDAMVKGIVERKCRERQPTPNDFLQAVVGLTCSCKRCRGTGAYITGSLNGQPTGPGGACFRCEGKGRQTIEDARRNRAYDAHYLARAS